jgi:hypothetical protein
LRELADLARFEEMTAKDGFDQLWGKLVDSASTKVAAEDAPEGGTKAWTEGVRAERKRDAEQEGAPSPAEEPAPKGATKLWTEAVRAERKGDDTPRRRPTPSSSSSALLGPDPERLHETADEEMARLMKPAPTPPPEIEATPDVDSPNRTFAWVAGAAAVAFAAYFMFGRDDEEDRHATPTAAQVEVAKVQEPALANAKSPENRDEAEPSPAREPPPAKDVDVPPPVEEEPTEDGPAPAPEPDADAREIRGSGDPRAVPPDTPPANASAFRKLPVSPADLAPVGAVGNNGVHVDRIAMGAKFEKSRCEGRGDAFSAARDDRINVCFRVVHPRQKEELVVLWQKDGGTMRRGKVVVKPAHAYRTRAYLILRREYVGTWKVRILDQDGVELASHPFKVVQ